MYKIFNLEKIYINYIFNKGMNRKRFYLNNTSLIKNYITITSVAALSAGLLISSANAAEWGQSGKGGDGGYSMNTKQAGKKGQTSVDGKGGDGGEAGSSADTSLTVGIGGNVGSTNPDQLGNIIGNDGIPPSFPAGCTLTGSIPCGVGGTGGGGGGSGLAMDNRNSLSHGNITGGKGASGGMNMGFPSGAGEGGNGGSGLHQSGGSFQNNDTLTGGAGGIGGVGGTSSTIGNPDLNPKDCKAGETCYTGRGGDGGAGADIRNEGRLTNNKVITGGNGGDGGGIFNDGPNYKLGDGGDGGNGVDLSGGSTLLNSGLISGGNAGTNPSKSTQPGNIPGKKGTDGIGVYAKGDNNTVVNQKGGVISAGGTDPVSGIAISLEGDNNTFERHNGSTINGIVEALGLNNGLSLGGDEDQYFNISEIGSKYKGFDRFQKDGKATATITGVATYTGETLINEGTLKLSKDGNLESSSGVRNNANFDISTIDGDSTKIKTLTGDLVGDREGAVVLLGGKELIITDGTGSYAGIINGNEKSKLTIEGGHETLIGNNSGYKGITTIKSGSKLTIHQDLGGTATIEQNGLLNGAGSIQNLANSGTLFISTDDGFNSKTIKGDYIGNGGTIVFNTKLGDDSSPTDHLNILGNTSGSSNVKVNNRDGLGAQTSIGIGLISVGGKSEGSFNLIGDYQLDGQNVIEAGAYAYSLQKGGTGGNDNDFYLTSRFNEPQPPQPEPCEITGTCPPPPPQPCEITGTCPPPQPPKPATYGASIPLMSAYTQVLRTFNRATTLQDRIGNRYWTGASARQISQGDGPGLENIVPAPDDNSVLTDYGLFWSKVSGHYDRFDPNDSTIEYRSKVNTWTFSAGIDNQLYENDAGHFIGGIWAEYGRIGARISADDRNGEIKANGYGVGASITWYGDDGLYIDGLGKLDWYKNDIDSDKSGGISIVNGAQGFGYALSIETGKRFDLNDYWSLTPQVQLSWSSLHMDDFRNAFGSTVSFERQNDLTARFGLIANYANTWQGQDGFAQRTSFYTGANLYQSLAETQSDVTISVVNLPNKVSAIIDPGSIGKTWAEIGIGGTYSWHDEKYSVFGNINAASSTKSFGGNYSISGSVGMRVKW